MLVDKVDILSVTVCVNIVVCTTVSVECNIVGCSVLAIQNGIHVSTFSHLFTHLMMVV